MELKILKKHSINFLLFFKPQFAEFQKFLQFCIQNGHFLRGISRSFKIRKIVQNFLNLEFSMEYSKILKIPIHFTKFPTKILQDKKRIMSN